MTTSKAANYAFVLLSMMLHLPCILMSQTKQDSLRKSAFFLQNAEDMFYGMNQAKAKDSLDYYLNAAIAYGSDDALYLSCLVKLHANPNYQYETTLLQKLYASAQRGHVPSLHLLEKLYLDTLGVDFIENKQESKESKLQKAIYFARIGTKFNDKFSAEVLLNYYSSITDSTPKAISVAQLLSKEHESLMAYIYLYKIYSRKNSYFNLDSANYYVSLAAKKVENDLDAMQQVMSDHYDVKNLSIYILNTKAALTPIRPPNLFELKHVR